MDIFIHVFRDCARSKQIWLELAEGHLPVNFFSVNMEEWIGMNLGDNHRRFDLNWPILYGVSAHLIWKCRNDMVFNSISTNANVMVLRILQSTKEIVQNLILFNRIKVLRNHVSPLSNIKWYPPMHGAVKINCDGSVRDWGAKAGAGAVIRNEDGAFLFGVASDIGGCSILEAEVKAILMGINLAIAKGFSNISVESDSLGAVRLITARCSSLHPLFRDICDIHSMMNSLGGFSVEHVLREANQVADGLAKYGLSLSSCSVVFDVVPSFISLAVLADCSGVAFPRGM